MRPFLKAGARYFFGIARLGRDFAESIGLARGWDFVILAGFRGGTAASVAQLAEQLICNQQVEGSSPPAGSIVFC